jgi:hypothetical protein
LHNEELRKLFSSPNHHDHRHWHDSPVWALAFLRIVRHSSLFDATLLQSFTPKILMSCLNLGLPTFLVSSGLVINTFFIILFSLARSRCSAYSNLFTFMNLIILLAKQNDLTKEDVMDRACNTHGRDEECILGSCGNPRRDHAKTQT